MLNFPLKGYKTTKYSWGCKNKKVPIRHFSYFNRGRMKGFEPSTFGTTIRRSNQLSYNLHF